MTVTTATIRVHVALIEWDSSETPSLHYGSDYATVARAAVRDCQRYIANDDPDFWTVRPIDVDALSADELRELHADYREAVTVPWVTFFEEELTGALA